MTLAQPLRKVGNPNDSFDTIKEYYGKVIKTKQDLQTSACCVADSVPVHLRAIVNEIHPDVQNKFYGCGSPIPASIEGCTVLDLGSGTGRDCFILAKLVGPNGQVIGVDMTDEQLAVANQHVDYHMKKFGFSKPNVRFLQGYIENLEDLDIASNSVDAVVSNCVLNLSPNKERVFSEIFRVLKPGGELYFSDVFAGRRIPKPLTEDPILLGECLGGALYIEDFRRILQRVGCSDYRVFNSTKLDFNNPEIERKAGMIDFYSMTIRAFKLDLEDRCEDYGQVAYYQGTIPEAKHAFRLDDHHLLKAHMPMLVCSNTAAMLSETRLAKHFKVVGDCSTHFGLFDCRAPQSETTCDGSPGGCC